MRRAITISGLVIALALGGVACGGDDSNGDSGTASGTDAGSESDGTETTGGLGGPSPLDGQEFDDQTGSATADVGVFDNSYRPQYVEVSSGTEVTFTNDGRTEHNVIPAEEGAFESIEVAQLGPDMAASITFDEPGDYAFYCSLHGTPTKGMIGGIRVVD